MKTAIPLPVLKSRAKALARQDNQPLHKALDRVAKSQGFTQWSHLAASQSDVEDQSLLSQLVPGDLMLLGARPGKGKTLMGLQLLADAIYAGHRGMFFTLEYTLADVVTRLRQIKANLHRLGDNFGLDTSDSIHADYIIRQTADMPKGTVVVVDYMQLLDQRRDHPDLMTQVRILRDHAARCGLIIVLISQIDRSYDPAARPCPDISDVRLPNPVDLSLFTKTCFLGDSGINVAAVPR